MNWYRRILNQFKPARIAMAVVSILVIFVSTTRASDGVPESSTGFASFYNGHAKHGVKGKYFAAHPKYPIGTILKVVNLSNHKSIRVEVIERGPSRRRQRHGVIIDLSKAAAKELDFVGKGRARVKIEVIKLGAQEP